MRSKKARRKVAPVVSAVRGKYSSASLQKGHWFLVTREHVIACRTDKATAEFRKLYDQGALQVLVLTDKDIIAGSLDDYVIVSHRWITPEHPDWDDKEPGNQSAKLKKLQEYLKANPDVKGIWMDFPCLPQGEKDDKEKAYFGASLASVNLLYLCANVLIFLDQKYMGRFWTQYEAFLAFHKVTSDGIVEKTREEIRERVTIIEMGAAAASGGSLAKSLIDTWHHKTVAEAVAILRKPDVEVTNKSDKILLLSKLPGLEEYVKARVAEIEQEERAALEAQVQHAKDLTQQKAAADAQARADAETRMEEEQNAQMVAEYEASMADYEAKIREREAAKASAAESEDYGRAQQLKADLDELEGARDRLLAAERDRQAARRSGGAASPSVVSSSSSLSSPSSGAAATAAEVAGLEKKLELLQERLDTAKAVPAEHKDTKLIKSLKGEIADTQKAKERKIEEQRRIEAEARAQRAAEEKRRAEEAAAREREEQQRQAQLALEKEQLAADQAAMEQEQKSIRAQIAAADEAEDYDRLEELQGALRALPKSLEEWRARKAAAEAAAKKEAELRAAEERAAEQRRLAAEEKARKDAERKRRAEERAAARQQRREAAVDCCCAAASGAASAAGNCCERQDMDRRAESRTLPQR